DSSATPRTYTLALHDALPIFKGDYCLVSVGRKPYTEGLNADKAGVKINDRGQIEVNEKLQTSAENIYAIGDVVKGAMLAHKASEDRKSTRLNSSHVSSSYAVF